MGQAVPDRCPRGSKDDTDRPVALPARCHARHRGNAPLRRRRSNRSGGSGTAAAVPARSHATGAPAGAPGTAARDGPAGGHARNVHGRGLRRCHSSRGNHRHRALDAKGLEMAAEFLAHRSQRRLDQRRPCHQHHVHTRADRLLSHRLAQQPLATVPRDGVAHPPRCHDRHTSRLRRLWTGGHMGHHQPPRTLPSAPHHPGDVGTSPESLMPSGAAAHADSFDRPRRRRLLITRRPPLVRMRARNPCLRERRRLFG